MFRCTITTHGLRAFAPSLFIPLLAASTLLARGATDIPADAPQDAIMAGPAEIQEMQDWASAAFTGRRPPERDPAVRVELRRQDHSSLGFGQSCMETPLKIRQRKFNHGLGTHANSEIVLRLPPDAKEFKAFVGIDNNPDTEGVRGSAQFSVEIAGNEVFRTPDATRHQRPGTGEYRSARRHPPAHAQGGCHCRWPQPRPGRLGRCLHRHRQTAKSAGPTRIASR